MSETSLSSMNNACGELYYSRSAQTSSRSTSSTHQKSYKSERLSKQHYSNKENEGNRKTLLAITVEIEDGCSGHIQMKEGDSAEGVARTFCRDYSLPDDLVGPLTEHILNNIINISKKDKNIVFCTTEERDAYEARLDQTTPGNYPDENDSYDERKSTGESGGQCQDSDSATACHSRSCGQAHMLTPRTIMKTRNMLAQRLSCPTHRNRSTSTCIRPTYTSRCPTHSSKSKALRTGNMKRRKRRTSEVAKAGCLRLYCDFLDRRANFQQTCRQSLKQYAEKIDRSRIKSPKKSWRVYRKRSEIAKRYRNYGELLYTEGLIMREKLLKQIEWKKKDDAEREMIGFTGRPKISERAKHLQRKGDIWNKLASEKFSCEQIRTVVMENQMAECTFMPRINPSADDATNGSVSRFEQLFFDSESRRRRQKQYADWYPEGLTFQPVTNRRCNGAEEPQVSVFDRLSQLGCQKLQEKKEMDRSSSECCGAPIDKSTGRELFKPQTGRKPQTARNPKNLPIGEFLHEMQGARVCKKEAMVEKEQQIVKDLAKCNYVTPQSRKYLTLLKPRAFKQMFDALDTDKDGYIQLCKVDARRVSFDAAVDIKTLIKMGEGNERLNCDAFHMLMQEVEEKYHKGSTVRGNLRHVSHVDNSNITFEPKIDGLSNDLAGRRRNYSTSGQWYDIILRDAEKRQQKVEALRKERQKIEMKECTFAPELLTKPSRRSKGATCRLSRTAPPPIPCSGPPILEKVAEEMHGFVFPNDESCACKELESGADGEADGGLADDKRDDGADDHGADDKSDDQGSDSTLLPSFGLFTMTQPSSPREQQPSQPWELPNYLGPQLFESLPVSSNLLLASMCQQRRKLKEQLRSLSKKKLLATMCRQQAALVEHFRIHDQICASKTFSDRLLKESMTLDTSLNQKISVNTRSVFDDEPRRRLPLEEMGLNFSDTNQWTPADSAMCFRPKTEMPSPYVDPRW